MLLWLLPLFYSSALRYSDLRPLIPREALSELHRAGKRGREKGGYNLKGFGE